MTEGPITAAMLDIPAALVADFLQFIVIGEILHSFFCCCCSNPPFEMDTHHPNCFKNIQHRHPSQMFQRTQGDLSPLPLIRGPVRGVTGDYDRWL